MDKVSLLLILSLLCLSMISGLFLWINPYDLAFSQETLGFLLFLDVTIIITLMAILIFNHIIKYGKKIIQLKQEKREIETQFKKEKNRFKTIFYHGNVGMAILKTDGQFIKVNDIFCQLFGYTKEEMLAINFNTLMHTNEIANYNENTKALSNQEISHFQIDQQCYKKNGELLWVTSALASMNDESSPALYVLQIQNISLQKQAEEQLKHMAYHDPLTGLANRNKLEQFINQTLASSRRHQNNFALLFLDLDQFKNINDTLGHEAGDIVLQIIAERLRSSVRSTDMVARLGGDEFVLLISDLKKVELVAVVAQKILDNILKPILTNSQEIYMTTSIGISLYPLDGQTMQVLMRNSDLALYRAKEHGRNNYQFYTNEMTIRAQEKMSITSALGTALTKNEFILNYQPKMNINTRKITGIEAFLRWKNPQYQSVYTDQIISLAEESGLIIPVSEWVLNTACKQLKKWHELGFTNLTMAVNISGRQFKQISFVQDVLDVLQRVGLPPSALEVEITESVIMQDTENALRMLFAFKDKGVQIVIDDFGTGYWSLSNLRRLSVDKIKIDKSFIKQLTFDETSASITSAIILMINKLGIVSIAEGVETKQQYEFLSTEGCTEIQGYYLTHPLEADKMGEFLSHPVPEAELSFDKEAQ